MIRHFSDHGMFSHRTGWPRHSNRISEALDARLAMGDPIDDLTVSNPTQCGFTYPEKEILAALSDSRALLYQPDPRGSLPAREAVSRYYGGKNIRVDPSGIFLTPGTSEAYSLIFALLCNPGESVLVPKPSYPLFEYLAHINDVELRYYTLSYDHEWHVEIDRESAEMTKAIVLVNPHNPTGAFLKSHEHEKIVRIAAENSLALIVDEVFIDYSFGDTPGRFGSTAGDSEVLTFTFNGISKMAGLPQMKLGWIVVSGPSSLVVESTERLEILCDTYLSVNTPVQVALPRLFEICQPVHASIAGRTSTNYTSLQNMLHGTPCSVLTAEGGWYGIIRVPRTKSAEAWGLELLDRKSVYLYPGYFFDFDEEGYLVVSLLPEPGTLRRAMGKLLEAVSLS